MSQDAYPPNPSDSASSPDYDPSAPYTPGNRPASGARRGTPGEVLSQGFQGNQNAGDFLGLDVEFAGSQPGQFGGDDLSLQGAPTTYAPASGYAGPAPIEEPVPVSADDFSQAPAAFEYGGDLGGDEVESVFQDEPTKSRAPLLVGGMIVAALAAGGYLYGPGLYERYLGGQTQVASQSVPRATPKVPARTTTPAEDAEQPLATDPAPEEPAATTTPSSTDASLATKNGSTGNTPRHSTPPTPTEDEPPAETPKEPQEQSPDLLGALLGTPPAPEETPAFPDIEGAEYGWATEDQLEMIWRGATLPLEAVKAPARTMMPRVGNVRVFTTSGDVFEGRLYAVGQNRVWIDAAPGRIGLDGDRVERIELLPASMQPNANGETAAAGKRVRVRVPGGLLFGRVLKVDGEDVTLLLDDGGKVRVKSADVEELGSGRAVVVRR